MKTITIIGLGNLGSALALVLLENGHKVHAFEHKKDVVDEINQHHTNSEFLPGVTFSEDLTASHDIQQVVSQASLIFNCLPSRFSASVLAGAAENLPENARCVNLSKGINSEGETVCQQLQKILGKRDLAMLSGPSLANEFSRKIATSFMLASENINAFEDVPALLNNDYLAVQKSANLKQVELGGILKNIYALGLGLLNDVPEPKLNLLGLYFTLALKEMQQLMQFFGVSSDGFLVSDLGDLVATALSDDSHNVRFAREVSAGKTLAELSEKWPVLPEGLNTTEQVLNRFGESDLPLAALINRRARQTLTSQDFVQGLLAVHHG